jgi:hypothetical protein
MNQFEAQLSRFLDATLGQDEAIALARHCERDSASLQELIDTYRLHGMLMARFQPSDSETADIVLAQIRRESDPFVQSVLRALPTPATSPTFPEWLQKCLWTFRLATRWAVPLLVTSTVALLIMFGIWVLRSAMGEPVLTDAHGSDIRVQRGNELLPALAGMRLQALDILRTGSNGSLALSYGKERSRLELKEDTTLKLLSWRRGKRFDLMAGTMKASVVHQRLFRPMRVATTHAEARVLGTKFTLTTSSDQTRLEVEQGRVRLTRLSDHAYVDVASTLHGVVFADRTNGPLAALPKTGVVTREWWRGVSWQASSDALDDPRFPTHPDRSDLADRFEVVAFITNHVGFRLCGYLHPPVSGNYEFWLAAQGNAQLFLSPDQNSKHKVAIATAAEAMQPRNWDAGSPHHGAAQLSEQIRLEAGRCYYIEAVAVVPKGEGHLSVAWKRPGAARELLSGEFLSPIESKK